MQMIRLTESYKYLVLTIKVCLYVYYSPVLEMLELLSYDSGKIKIN